MSDTRQMMLPFNDARTICSRRVAKFLGCSMTTIYRLLEAGEFRGYRLSRRGWWRIYLESFIEYLKRSRTEYTTTFELEDLLDKEDDGNKEN
jgi:excisionase family DNA binding protein